MEHKVVTDYTDSTSTGNDNIKVFVRGRPPMNGAEVPKPMWCLSKEKLSIKDPSRHVGEHAFLFDEVFWTETSQDTVFQQVAKPLVDHCIKGYNGCVFAYGQTGSGKTYSIFGGKGSKRGILPRCVEYIFDNVDKQRKTNPALQISVEVSLLEMYCDDIRDLGRAYLDKKGEKNTKTMKTADWYLEKARVRQSFAGGNTPTEGDRDNLGLEIHESLGGDVFVKDLSVIPVTKVSEVIDIVEKGFGLRATHETKMNKYSSRSHTVFTVKIIQTNKKEESTVSGTLNLVDLAGSERLGKSESTGQRLRETLSINRSLSALGKVAAALDPLTPCAYIPYRDSKLTRLLQNSLGGNSHTSLLATLHPTRPNYDECLCTLQFANRCRCVVNQPRINYTDAQGRNLLQSTIRRLQAEVKRLRLVMAVVVAQKNKQLEEVLSCLGMKETKILADGRVQLKNGKTIGSKIDIGSIERRVVQTTTQAKPISYEEEGSSACSSPTRTRPTSVGRPGSPTRRPNAKTADFPSRRVPSAGMSSPSKSRSTVDSVVSDLGISTADLTSVGLSQADVAHLTTGGGIPMASGSIDRFDGGHQQFKAPNYSVSSAAARNGDGTVRPHGGDLFGGGYSNNFGGDEGIPQLLLGSTMGPTSTSSRALPHQHYTPVSSSSSIINKNTRDRWSDQRVSAGAVSNSSNNASCSEEAEVLRSRLTAVKKENSKLRDKIERHKTNNKTVSSEHRKQMEKMKEESRKQRDEIADLKRQISNLNLASENRDEVLKREYAQKIQDVVKNSVQLQSKAQLQMAQIPESLKVDSAKIHAANKASELTGAQLERKHALHIKQLIQANELQLGNIQQQAEYWVMKKDLECRRFVDDFNRYHRKRSAEVQEYRKELILLYEHCNNLTRVMNRVQQGVYKMRVSASRQSILREICIQDAPDEGILSDTKRLQLLKEQISSLAEFEANQSHPPVHPSTPSREKKRPISAGVSSSPQPLVYERPVSAPPPQEDGDVGEEELPQNMLENVEYKGVKLDADPKTMDPEDLPRLVDALRKFFVSDFSKQVIEDHLLRKMSNNATLSYIRTLEEGLETYKQSFKVEAEKYKNLRIAFDSQQRRNNKSMQTRRRVKK